MNLKVNYLFLKILNNKYIIWLFLIDLADNLRKKVKEIKHLKGLM